MNMSLNTMRLLLVPPLLAFCCYEAFQIGKKFAVITHVGKSVVTVRIGTVQTKLCVSHVLAINFRRDPLFTKAMDSNQSAAQ